MARTTDSEEAIAMLKAADWLALPSVTWNKGDPNAPRTPQQLQVMNQNKAAAARYRAYRQAHHPDALQSDSQSAPPPANGQNPPAAPNNQ